MKLFPTEQALRDSLTEIYGEAVAQEAEDLYLNDNNIPSYLLPIDQEIVYDPDYSPYFYSALLLSSKTFGHMRYLSPEDMRNAILNEQLEVDRKTTTKYTSAMRKKQWFVEDTKRKLVWLPPLGTGVRIQPTILRQLVDLHNPPLINLYAALADRVRRGEMEFSTVQAQEFMGKYRTNVHLARPQIQALEDSGLMQCSQTKKGRFQIDYLVGAAKPDRSKHAGGRPVKYVHLTKSELRAAVNVLDRDGLCVFLHQLLGDDFAPELMHINQEDYNDGLEQLEYMGYLRPDEFHPEMYRFYRDPNPLSKWEKRAEQARRRW